MRTSMNVLVWTSHLTPDQFPLLEKLKRLGYDGVELPMFQGEVAHFAGIGKELKRQGLGCTAVTVMTPETNPVSPDAAVRRAATDRLKWAIDSTAAAGGDVLCGPMHSALGVFTGAGPTADEHQRAVEVLASVGDYAAKANVRLAVEFLCRFESYVLTTARDALALAQEINHPAIGVLYDTFHANIEEQDPARALATLGNRLYHFHVSENDRGTPGSGHVPWTETFRALHAMNYDGWLTVEAFGRAMPEIAAATRVWRDFFPSADDLCVQSLAFLRRMWAQTE